MIDEIVTRIFQLIIRFSYGYHKIIDIKETDSMNINSDLGKMLHLKSSRCYARHLPEGAVLFTKLFASESQILQCLAPQTLDHGIYATAELEAGVTSLQQVSLV